MRRLACVSLPELPLQMAIRAHPEWRELPVVVLTEDRPTGTVLHGNRAALRSGVRRLMRDSAALALCANLRAAVVGHEQIREGLDLVARRLQAFSPRVEVCRIPQALRAQPAGIFWVDAEGLGYLFSTLEQWMDEIRGDLETLGFRARLAAGFTRGGTLVAARTVSEAAPLPRSFATADEEMAHCGQAPLKALPLGPAARSRLGGLGVRTVRDFLELPEGGVRLRFGKEAGDLHDLLRSPERLPIQPLAEKTDPAIRRRFDREITDTTVLQAALEQTLQALAAEAARVGERIREIHLTLTTENGDERVECIRPSEPTAAQDLLGALLRLRVESIFQDLSPRHRAGVTAYALRVDRVRATDGQIDLLRVRDQATVRDQAAAARALSLIRAELGNDTVCRVCLRPEHPPERQYEWEIVAGGAERPPPAAPPPAAPPPAAPLPILVRRIFESPAPVRESDGRVCGGPYTVSGGWWAAPFDREYRFVETPDGAVLWIVREGPGQTRPSRVWKLQGVVG